MNLPFLRAVALTIAVCLPAAAEPSAESLLEQGSFQGGLIVHLGCGDGQLTAALGDREQSLVQGLDKQPANVDVAQDHIRSLGTYGRVHEATGEAIVIDPKGDIANLMLTFPGLAGADFRPWIEEAEATRHGETVDEYAATVAQRWRDGLAQWGQDGQRIAKFRESVDLTIYTPGSNAGVPLTEVNCADTCD